MSMKPALQDKYRFRDELVDDLVLDVVGPGGGEDELLEEAPLGRYLVGVLWPSDDDLQEGIEPDGAEPEKDGATDDSPVAQARMRFPSSMGLTFSVRVKDADSITIAPSAARYEEQPLEGGDEGKVKRNRDSKWRRVPAVIKPLVQGVTKPGTFRDLVAPGLQLYRYVRPARDGVVTVSVALRNVQVPPLKQMRDSFSWFQVELDIQTDQPAIVDRTKHRNAGKDDDLDSSALLYRNAYTFAIGHGCAVDWDLETSVGGATTTVTTTFLPSYEVARARPALLKSVDLRMSFLSDASKDEVIGSLETLAQRYRAWIAKLGDSLSAGETDVSDGLLPTAKRHIKEAGIAAGRIEAGIRLLRDDDDALDAFRLANKAMQLQRARQDWVRSGAKGDVGDGAGDQWYPFQIAYILLNLPGLTDRRHEDREKADLLWFPTGGGKTEAYLGLVAYSIIVRRLRDSDATGVAVIMRYTLRLLTIQQFERATMLICSLETVRKSESRLGKLRFSIGLWVGSGATPNSLSDAKKSLRELASGRDLQDKNPVQLTQCPWCGTALDHKNYTIRAVPEKHMRIGCRTPGCDFSDGLPVHLIDEDVYRERPELILGTVDKFAAMAWNENVGKLFARDGKGYPPDLIIQDELHLISGPLGSIVGLYETAVDAACEIPSIDDESNRARPKVIASTATIRRAQQQIRSVFDREAAQFPPPGINPDESFFAEPAPSEALGTRRYVGVMAPGASHATLLVRVYSALLQAAKDVQGDDVTRDPYWTLLGYFNSLRVLGSGYLQVESDVRERLGVVAGRKGTDPRLLTRAIGELTSRVASSEIPQQLKQLENKLGGPEQPLDVVLATNMISVGVDIDRLGLMAVMGQPQASAEYIQATSRVGRKHPGLVVTIFNAARSRDRSHYENFLPFHQALYRAVEATSATPFAARARDRGLHGVLVSLVRLLVPELSSDGSAYRIDDSWDAVTAIADLIARRVHNVADDEELDTKAEVAQLLGVWSDAADEREYMRYRNSKNLEAALLVDPATALVDDDIDYSQSDVPWPTLQSMRDVDAESGLYQIPMSSMRRSS
ncbi:UNVERIFIED_CONTAM: helicase-like protein [Williamsia faeni]